MASTTEAMGTATEIFEMFLWNNVHQGARYGVEDLLAIDQEREFRYTMAGQHYLATVASMELWEGPCVSIVITCPLPETERHDGCWVSGRFMRDGIGKHFSGTRLWYSARPDSMALILQPMDMRNRHCRITFVRGPGLKVAA